MIKKCLFPAAGYGTRFLPATKATPKEMLPVLTKPLIQYGVEEALDAGINTMAPIIFHMNMKVSNMPMSAWNFMSEKYHVPTLKLSAIPVNTMDLPVICKAAR